MINWLKSNTTQTDLENNVNCKISNSFVFKDATDIFDTSKVDSPQFTKVKNVRINKSSSKTNIIISNTIEESKFDDEIEKFETLLKDLKDDDSIKSRASGI